MDEEKKELSKHDLKQLKRAEKENLKTELETAKNKIRFTKNVIKYGGIVVIIIGIIAVVFALNRNSIDGNAVNEGPYTQNAVHWHASLDVFICGQKELMPAPFGDAHIGTPLLHTHADRLIHIEGKVWNKEDIMLGKYMDNIGVEFDRDKILDYVNGDGCNNGAENIVKMFVNGNEDFEFRDYVINDGDKIEIRYE